MLKYVCVKIICYTRYTVRGRGAKHFFPSGSAPGGSLPEAAFLSHT